MINEEQFAVAVSNEQHEAFYDGIMEEMAEVELLYSVVPHDKMTKKFVPYGGAGLYSGDETPYEGDEPADLDAREGYPLEIDLTQYRNQLKMGGGTWETMSPSDQALLFKQMGAAGMRTKTYAMGTLIANAFTTSLGGDGKVLCADDHPLKGGGVGDNKVTTALDADNVAAAMALARAVPTDQGVASITKMKFLATHASKSKVAHDICGGVGPGSTTNGEFWRMAGLTPVIIDETDDLTDWFLLTIDALVYVEQKALAPFIYLNPLTGNYHIIGEFRGGVGCPSWRRIFGASVT